MKNLFLLFLSALLVSSVFAKRAAPIEVPALAVGDVTISAPHFAQINGVPIRGGVLEARDSRTKRLIWSVQVYKTKYDLGLEKDIQDVFIKTLSHDVTHGLLIMSDERDRVFVVDLKTRKVTPLERSGTTQKAEAVAPNRSLPG
ncbi:MAG: hypothetical protein K9N23_01565 [Akkermansiaceae bacterium]|nr:hypothetical protein [Akkermansiaceae bacterium]MCF7730338.1 hypothetical protein [Akkermansiaceae bacterium]